jgi:hypothetical protein
MICRWDQPCFLWHFRGRGTHLAIGAQMSTYFCFGFEAHGRLPRWGCYLVVKMLNFILF